MEEALEPIKPYEPETNFNQMDYLREFLIQGKKKSDFSSFIRKMKKNE